MLHGGLDAVSKIVEKADKPYEKLRIKILTLLDDMLVERDSKDDIVGSESGQIDLESHLKDAGWCSILEHVLVMPKQDRRTNREDLLSVMSEQFPIRTEHDTVEKVKFYF